MNLTFTLVSKKIIIIPWIVIGAYIYHEHKHNPTIRYIGVRIKFIRSITSSSQYLDFQMLLLCRIYSCCLDY